MARFISSIPKVVVALLLIAAILNLLVGVFLRYVMIPVTDWLDVLLWGHQITLQRRPQDVLAPEAQGKRHFGVVLPWAEWEALADRLVASGTPLLAPPAVSNRGTPQELGKIYLSDPSHNVVEIKAYRDLAATIGYEAP